MFSGVSCEFLKIYYVMGGSREGIGALDSLGKSQVALCFIINAGTNPTPARESNWFIRPSVKYVDD